MARRLGWIAVVVVAISPLPLPAQTVRSVGLAFDNDGFNFWIPPRQRSDWFYTHGTHLDFVLATRPPAAGLLGVTDAEVCDGERREGTCVSTRLRVGQEIYTPSTLFSYFPPAGDRPYAGWLSVALTGDRLEPGRIRSVGLEVGVTGSPSLGGQAHRAIHRWLDKADPSGWEYQIPFEPALAVTVRETRLVPRTAGSSRGPSAALVTTWGADLGTLRTSGRGGLGARLGWGAPPGHEWARLRSASRGAWLVAEVGVEAEVVVHDLFIDGSLWRDSARTTREPLLGRLRLEALLGWRGSALQVGITRSSRAFTLQPEGHTFGTLGLVIVR